MASGGHGKIAGIIAASLAATSLAGCDSFPQAVFNCNDFPVRLASGQGTPLTAHSQVYSMNAKQRYDSLSYVYPDGSSHTPRLVSRAQAEPVRRNIGQPPPSPAAEVAGICKAFGPGMVVIADR